MNTAAHSILCIEDDEDTCELIDFVFRQEGFQVLTCSHKDCLKMIDKEQFSAVILDNYFGDLSGLDICRRIRESHPQTPIIFFSGESRKTEVDRAMEAGASRYLVKPLDFEKLVPTIRELFAQDFNRVLTED